MGIDSTRYEVSDLMTTKQKGKIMFASLQVLHAGGTVLQEKFAIAWDVELFKSNAKVVRMHLSQRNSFIQSLI